MSLPNRYLNKLKELCEDSKKKNIECLMQIISDNKDTDFGKDHDFACIDSYEEYIKRVSVSEYEYFEDYAKREYDGEGNKLTAHDIYSFCKSSGSSGNAKIIPVTKMSLSKEVHLIRQLEAELIDECGGKILKLGICRTDLSSDVEKTLLISEILYRYAYENGLISPDYYLGGCDLLFQKGMDDYHFAKLWASLLSEQITVIESIYLYDAVRFFDYLKMHHVRILDAIEKGEKICDVSIPDRVWDYLLACEVSKERIDFLRSEFDKGFLGIAHRIWPRLKMCIGISGRSYAAEERTVREYLGDVPILYHSYYSSEAFIGYPIKENSYEYVVIPQNTFIEFGTMDGTEEKIHTLDELEVGRSYELILTTFSGLYRYRLNDIVCCTGYFGESPKIEFVTRRNQAINLAGEKVSMSQTEELAEQLLNRGIELREYVFFACIDEVPYKYMGVAVADISENAPSVDMGGYKDISDMADELLRNVNIDYDDLRRIGDLAKPFVISVDSQRYRDFIRYLYYDYQGENKPIHVLRQELFKRACQWVLRYTGREYGDNTKK